MAWRDMEAPSYSGNTDRQDNGNCPATEALACRGAGAADIARGFCRDNLLFLPPATFPPHPSFQYLLACGPAMRPAYALIDLSALRHNYRLAKRLTGCNALAVVKANAYGHGALECAAALNEDADGFAVAAIEEALALREAGHRQPIVLLEGWFEAAELELICRHDLWPVVHHHGQLADLREANLSRPLQVWLKLDSGMHRTGFSPVEYPQIWRELQASNKVASLTKITHFARADEPETGRTEEQLETFMQGTAGLEGPCSLSNSAGVLAWPNAYGD